MHNNVSAPGLLGRGRSAALLLVVAGAVGSIVFFLRAGGSRLAVLFVLFVIWILSPFAALWWANFVSRRWSAITQASIYCVTVVITLGALAAFGGVIPAPSGAAHGFMFVMVPLVSLLVMATVVPMAARMARRRSGPREGD